MKNKCRTKGFTLAEATMAMVIMSFAAVGLLLPFTTGATLRAEGMQYTLASKLAGDLIEEVTSLDFDQIVDTYNYTEAKGQVTDASGTAFTNPEYANFSRKVESKYVYVPQESGNGSVKFILVTVSVFYDNEKVVTVNRLITE